MERVVHSNGSPLGGGRAAVDGVTAGSGSPGVRSIPSPRPRLKIAGVNQLQWMLAIVSLVLAVAGCLTDSIGALAVLILLLTALNVVLMLLAGVEVLHGAALGKLVLLGATFLFFWSEALSASGQDPPYPVPWTMTVAYVSFPPEIVSQSFFYIALFQLCLLVGYSRRLRPTALIAWVSARQDSPSAFAELMRYAMALCAWIPLLTTFRFEMATAFESMIASRSGVSGSSAAEIGFIHYLTFLGMYGAALFLARGAVLTGLAQKWCWLVGLAAALPLIMWSGTRHLWLFVAVPAFICLIAIRQRRIGLTDLMKWAGMLVIIVLVAQIQLAVRNEGWDTIRAVNSDQLLQINVTGQFTALLYAEYIVPDTHEYFLEAMEPYFFIHWIPRQLWPAKPIPASWRYYNEMYVQGNYFNVTPSIIGQYYINFGVFGVAFGGLWLGFLMYLTDSVLVALDVRRQIAICCVIGSMYAFIISSFRFYSPIYFTYVMAAAIGMLFLVERSQKDSVAVPQAFTRRPVHVKR